MTSVRALAGVLLSAVAACGRHGDPTASAAAAASAPPLAPQSAAEPSRPGTPCGDLACAQYDSPEDAFREVIAGAPAVLAVGEAHAPRGATVASAARRFTEALLPLLRGRASDLLVELMMPPASCGAASATVRTKQQVVTSRQADTNQNEYLEMGERAHALGIVPDMLRPTCLDVARMGNDREDAVDVALATIARLTTTQAVRLVERDQLSDSDAGKMVVIYGGALHNDLAPRPEKARWSYAPDLAAYTHGRVVSLDVVVPEFIGDDEAWSARPWRAAYDVRRLGGKTTLFRTGDQSYVMVFARSAAARDD